MNEEEELQRLRRRAERLAREQQRLLDQIERAKAEALPPEERQRRFRVIPGGAAAVTVLAWLWACRPARPVLAALTSALLGTLLVGVPAPAPEPPAADSPPATSPPDAAPPPDRAELAPARGGTAPEPAVPLPTASPTPTAAPRPPSRPPATSPQPSSPSPTPVPTSLPPVPSPAPEPVPEPDGSCLRVPVLDLELCVGI